jgi:hypothetical protein
VPPFSPTALVRATAAAPPSSAYRPQRCGAGCAASLLTPRTCGARQRRGHTVSMPVIHRSSRGEARGLTRWKRSASPPQPLFAGSGLGARPGTSSPRSPAGSCWPPGLFPARRSPSHQRSSHAAVRSGSSPNPPRRPMSCSSRLSPSCSSSVTANSPGSWRRCTTPSVSMSTISATASASSCPAMTWAPGRMRDGSAAWSRKVHGRPVSSLGVPIHVDVDRVAHRLTSEWHMRHRPVAGSLVGLGRFELPTS